MFLSYLSITNFKNIINKEFYFSKKIICFYGENGVGKTNILDAIYFCAYSKSFLNYSDSQLITLGESFFRISSDFDSLESKKKIVIKYKQNSKTIELNDSKLMKKIDIIGQIPIVCSSPSDIFLLYGGSDERRKYMDIILCVIDRRYCEELIKYNKVLDQRNSLLKRENEVDKDLLRFYNEKLTEYSSYIYRIRNNAMVDIVKLTKKWYINIANKEDNLTIKYYSQLENSTLLELLKINEQKDIITKRTNYGIHKDDIMLNINNIDIKKIASQGQQKSLLYSLRLAQAEFLYKNKNEKVIYIVDDISDKLDTFRLEKYTGILENSDFISQVFLTDTNNKVFETIKNKEEYEIYSDLEKNK